MINNAEKNIILIGFMASGKSHLGKILAHDLGFELIDVDMLIEQEEGENIKDIFANAGEAYFREKEYKTILKLKNKNRAVIVTGGGAPVYFATAQLLQELGHIFHLDASFALIKYRLERSTRRPLGAASSPQELNRLFELYRFRRPIYSALGQVINVDHQDSRISAALIKDCFLATKRLGDLKTIRVHDSANPYTISIGEKTLFLLPSIIESLGLSNYRPVLITSSTIKNVLAQEINTLLDRFDEAPPVITIDDGEQNKNLSTISRIHDQLFEQGFNRSSLIIALGGGTLGDMAAFAGAIYLRGVPVIQIPTTLLAMVDSSVGGKTGVDVSYGKNLIGAFHMPKAVLIDPSLLKTLPQDEYACGMAEIIKHAIIGDRALFKDLQSTSIAHGDLIKRAIMVKVHAVIDDPHEKHVRAHLNLGHTFAHAIEKVCNFTIKHGQAVAIGLVCATKLSRRLNLLEEDFVGELEALLSRYDLPTTLPSTISEKDLLAAMKHDKKRDERGLRFILPHRIGVIGIHYVAESQVFSDQ